MVRAASLNSSGTIRHLRKTRRVSRSASFFNQGRRNRIFQRHYLIRGCGLRSRRSGCFSDSLVRSVSLVQFIERRMLKPGESLGTNLMKPRQFRKTFALDFDLKSLRQLAYHRFGSRA